MTTPLSRRPTHPARSAGLSPQPSAAGRRQRAKPPIAPPPSFDFDPTATVDLLPDAPTVQAIETASSADFEFDPTAIVDLSYETCTDPIVDPAKGSGCSSSPRRARANRKQAKVPKLDLRTIMAFVATGTPPILALVSDPTKPDGRTVLIDIRAYTPKIIGYLPPKVIRTMLGKQWLERQGAFFRVTNDAQEAATRDFADANNRPLPKHVLSGEGRLIFLAPDAEYPHTVEWPADFGYDRIPGQPWISIADGP